MSILVGIIGTGIGGLITALFGTRTDKMISLFLSFAGGVMTSIVFFELIPEAEKLSNIAIIVIGLFIGVAMVLSLNTFIDKISNAGHKIIEPHETLEEFYHEREMISHTKNMLRSGMLMFFVIGLHNVPEGLAIGTAGNYNIDLSFRLAIIIGIHNLPEGMAISAPLISGGVNKWKSVFLTLLAGVPTVLGAIIGSLIGSISDIAVALSFSIAGGAMLYVVFGEILPQSMSIRKDRIPTIVLLIGIVFGQLLSKI
ncbi:MAG: ZIP family metal transporter [Spirochaetaceae bacterium]|nr:ZIP family metal transporter [Spirochaetaceae bacterium]